MKKMVSIKNNKVYCNSLIFSKELELNHRDVLKDIRKLTATNKTVKDQFLETEYTNSRNRKYPMFIMTKKGFMSLMMNTNVLPNKKQKLYQVQNKFIDAFDYMENLLLKERNNKQNLEWKKSREQGKKIRLAFTNVIKEFVDYAEKQGSKNAKRYYTNITKMEYKALGLIQESKPNLRDALDMMELHQIILAEDLARRKINVYMGKELHYKEIYLLVKQDIESFASSLFLEKI